ncbi:Calmodulin-regulated spectrin-associated protein 3 [Saguinus oedipus]|uniref:Calmodulin-regulated spectrin-associated protein 3 n=1 Tax=Saguinus oedipus TaxID=9490 RepID=A0ABQ9WCG6_SAGOE|nr:Calmodulin-regulated spectrin-associated protein 3 [Saguinus oedipus]
MTSFAEPKKQLVKAEAETGAGSPMSSPTPPETLSSEMSELGSWLEEKHRAIEAQKRRIEAIVKHRQQLSKSALLQVQPREASGKAEAKADPGPVLGGEQPAGEGQGEPTSRSKAVTFSQDLGPLPPQGQYMQRLMDQQQRLLALPEAPGPAPPPAAWIFPDPTTTGPKALSPSLTRRVLATWCSPGPRPSQSPRSPKHTQPAELRLAPLTRVLIPPHDVDSHSHLHKFSLSQLPVQTCSSILLAEGTAPEEPAPQPGLI